MSDQAILWGGVAVWCEAVALFCAYRLGYGRGYCKALTWATERLRGL